MILRLPIEQHGGCDGATHVLSSRELWAALYERNAIASLQAIARRWDRLHLPFYDQLFDGTDRLCRVQSLWARVGAVHDGVAAIQLERILQ